MEARHVPPYQGYYKIEVAERSACSSTASLEEFFLELVEEARQEGAEPSGALTGSGVADFLSRKETGEAAQQPGGGKQKDESQDKDAG